MRTNNFQPSVKQSILSLSRNTTDEMISFVQSMIRAVNILTQSLEPRIWKWFDFPYFFEEISDKI